MDVVGVLYDAISKLFKAMSKSVGFSERKEQAPF
jgi:hypothetical protein